jgi:hypothetical protein
LCEPVLKIDASGYVVDVHKNSTISQHFREFAMQPASCMPVQTTPVADKYVCHDRLALRRPQQMIHGCNVENFQP